NMASPIKLFVDSDVIISSLLSTSGAAFMLLNQIDTVELHLSNFSISELERVAQRLDIHSPKLNRLIDTRFTAIALSESSSVLRKQYAAYVLDANDAHIVAAAKQAQTAFLLSYNIRHFQADKLKQDFQIILMTPGTFLQYLRSL
ncbi:MAG TPA: PIN domain-containing protein, partial [Candidatus Saccharimonadales bacterium]|nr:PIN domain-containing protein [Candidatus Saccharimonadales bacterium]